MYQLFIQNTGYIHDEYSRCAQCINVDTHCVHQVSELNSQCSWLDSMLNIYDVLQTSILLIFMIRFQVPKLNNSDTLQASSCLLLMPSNYPCWIGWTVCKCSHWITKICSWLLPPVPPLLSDTAPQWKARSHTALPVAGQCCPPCHSSVHTKTHRYKHRYTHTHKCVCMHTHPPPHNPPSPPPPHTHTHTEVHNYVQRHVNTYTYIHMSMYIHAHIYTLKQTCWHTGRHTHTNTHTYIHTHTHTHTHTNTHTHTQTHTYTHKYTH